MSTGILIVSGYNMRAVVAFCRWADARRLPFYLVARDRNDPVFLTAYRDRVLLTRDSRQLDAGKLAQWIALLRQRHGHNRALLLPSTEFLNRCMLAQRAELEAAGAVIPLVQRALYEQLSDKYSFGAMCQAAGIAVPAEYASLPGHFPFVAKPRNYASIGARQLKPHLIDDEAGLRRFLDQEDGADYYYQQFIDGRSLYLLAHVPRSGAPALFAQENLIQQPDGGSVILARADDFHLHPAARPYLDLLANCGFHGLVMIEVRLEPSSGTYYMIEANPRLWGPMQLVVDNDTGIFDSLLRDYGFAWQDPPPQSSQPWYFWSGGLADGAGARYHNYTPARFADRFQSIERASLFLRDDTMPLFRHELAPASDDPTS